MNEEFSPGNKSDDPDFGLPEVTLDPIERGGMRKRGGSVSTGKRHSQGQSKQNNTPLIVGLLFVFLVSVAALWYFFGADLFSSQQADANIPVENNNPIDNDLENQDLETNFDTLGTADPDNNFNDLDDTEGSTFDNSANNPINNISTQGSGTFELVEGRTGRTYVIIGSFIDEDLAKDHADILANQGTNTKLLAPVGDVHYYRLSVADYSSISEAAGELESLRNTYGNPNLWIIKR